jgi:hypothetical protein
MAGNLFQPKQRWSLHCRDGEEELIVEEIPADAESKPQPQGKA